MLFRRNKKKLVIGLVEPVTFDNGKVVRAKIDTGADSSSIDEGLLELMGKEKSGKHKIIKSALGKMKRPTVTLEVEFQGIKFIERFTVSNRANLKYKLLIGKDILKKEGFLIDPCK